MNFLVKIYEHLFCVGFKFAIIYKYLGIIPFCYVLKKKAYQSSKVCSIAKEIYKIKDMQYPCSASWRWH